MTQTERDKMLAGKLYDASDKELKHQRLEARRKLMAFNAEQDEKKRSSMLKAWFGTTGEHIFMETGFVCDYGNNIHVGENFYANFNQTFFYHLSILSRYLMNHILSSVVKIRKLFYFGLKFSVKKCIQKQHLMLKFFDKVLQ